MVVCHVGFEPVPEWREVTEAQQSVEQAEKIQIVMEYQGYFGIIQKRQQNNSKISLNIFVVEIFALLLV